MLELGATEDDLHRALADHPGMSALDIVHCVGPRMRSLWQALPAERRGRWCDTANELVQDAHHLVDAGDIVLVKGSKGSKVSLLVDPLRKLRQADASDTQGAI